MVNGQFRLCSRENRAGGNNGNTKNAGKTMSRTDGRGSLKSTEPEDKVRDTRSSDRSDRSDQFAACKGVPPPNRIGPIGLMIADSFSRISGGLARRHRPGER